MVERRRSRSLDLVGDKLFGPAPAIHLFGVAGRETKTEAKARAWFNHLCNKRRNVIRLATRDQVPIRGKLLAHHPGVFSIDFDRLAMVSCVARLPRPSRSGSLQAICDENGRPDSMQTFIGHISAPLAQRFVNRQASCVLF